MHELSIAHNIVDIVVESAKNNAAFVSKVVLSVGEASGIVIEALETAMDSAVKNTLMHDSEIEIIHVPSKLKCVSCGEIIKSKELFVLCPSCNSFTEIIEGKELQIKTIEIN